MTRPAIRLFVSDVDGTLVRHDKNLSPATVAAFARLRAAGVEATLISARPPSGMLRLARELDIQGPLGAFNGGTILRADGVIERAERLTPWVVQTVLERLEAAGVDIWLFAHDRWYARTLDNIRVPRERLAADVDATIVATFDGIDQADKIVGISEDFASLERLEAEVLPLVGHEATVARSQPYFLDVTALAANKGDGIAAIAEAAGVPLAQACAIGDMPNDLPMFAQAGLSIAMGQAPEAVRAAADFVTSSNEEDGVAAAIDRYVLLASASA